MENLGIDQSFWKGRRVFVTGHTGFKGGWFVIWLQKLGAIVSGYSLSPPTEPNLYTAAGVHDGIQSTTGDVRQLDRLQETMTAAAPEVTFHFAAQPLVRASYAAPVDTFAANVMGTVNYLEAVRETPSVRAALVVTSDKCYQNRDGDTAHREDDPLGGDNAYASSKACAELVVEAYRRSFFSNGRAGLATVRAGNVIGGGDWAEDRLFPDLVRAFSSGNVLSLRYPNAVRPWQHVLDPLCGYLRLAQQICRYGNGYARGWNFGLDDASPWTVKEIVLEAAALWGEGAKWTINTHDRLGEDTYLNIDATMAREKLDWQPKLDIKSALKWTVQWYRAHLEGNLNMREFTLHQIKQYESMAS